jgi:hypothetical protein
MTGIQKIRRDLTKLKTSLIQLLKKLTKTQKQKEIVMKLKMKMKREAWKEEEDS